MDALTLLALAMAPGMAISLFVYFRDKFEKEPKRLLVISFFLGVLSIIPAIIIEEIAFATTLGGNEMLNTAIYAFLFVGFTEELCKYVMLRLFAYRRKEFNEPYDGIIYAVMVSMGFATLENIMYVFQYGAANAFLRMFTAVPAHATFGIIMGYYAGMAKFSHQPSHYLWRGLLAATFFHGAYDFCLMEQTIPLLYLGAFVSLYIGIRLSLKAIRLHQHSSPFRR